MPFFRVTYQSMTAFYGPSFIEADSEYEARRKFAGSAFSQGEMSLIKATSLTAAEIRSALNMREER